MTDFGYNAWHMQLRALKGAPDLCVSCDGQATDWALKDDFHAVGEMRYVEDPEAYEAMCRSCHVKRDRQGWSMSDESRERIAASKRGKPRSEETRRKVSDTLKGRPRDPEAVAKGADKLRGVVRDESIAAKGWERRRALYGPTGRKSV